MWSSKNNTRHSHVERVSQMEGLVNPQNQSEEPVASQDSLLSWTKKSVRWYDKLKDLYELWKKHPEDLQQGLSKICVCTENFKIGDGRDGTTVYVGFDKNDCREAAVKRVPMHAMKHATAEVKNLLELDHVNIVKYQNFVPHGDYIYIMLDLYDFTVDEWMKREAVKNMSMEDWSGQATGLVKDFVTGLEYLHSKNIIHRDLKPENLFVVSSNNSSVGGLKIADFGLARLLAQDKSGHHSSSIGTEHWMAKDVLDQLDSSVGDEGQKNKIKHTKKSDIQVAGMVSFFIMTKGKHPYGKPSDRTSNIVNGRKDLKEVEDTVGCNFIEGMLADDANVRLLATQLVRHPYFWSIERRFDFLADIGGEHEVKIAYQKQYDDSSVEQSIENAKSAVLKVVDGKNSWSELNVISDLGRHFKTDLGRPGYTESVCSFLLFLRNIKTHYDDESPIAQRTLGLKSSLYDYFCRQFPKKFPMLLLKMHSIIKGTAGQQGKDDWTGRPSLKYYFLDGNMMSANDPCKWLQITDSTFK